MRLKYWLQHLKSSNASVQYTSAMAGDTMYNDSGIPRTVIVECLLDYFSVLWPPGQTIICIRLTEMVELRLSWPYCSSSERDEMETRLIRHRSFWLF